MCRNRFPPASITASCDGKEIQGVLVECSLGANDLRRPCCLVVVQGVSQFHVDGRIFRAFGEGQKRHVARGDGQPDFSKVDGEDGAQRSTGSDGLPQADRPLPNAAIERSANLRPFEVTLYLLQQGCRGVHVRLGADGFVAFFLADLSDRLLDRRVLQVIQQMVENSISTYTTDYTTKDITIQEKKPLITRYIAVQLWYDYVNNNNKEASAQLLKS